MKNNLGKWLGVIRRGNYQVSAGDIRWKHETVSDLCPDVYLRSYCNEKN